MNPLMVHTPSLAPQYGSDPQVPEPLTLPGDLLYPLAQLAVIHAPGTVSQHGSTDANEPACAPLTYLVLLTAVGDGAAACPRLYQFL